VPQQALFLLNGPFVLEQVRRLIHRPEVENQNQPEARIQALHRLVFSRAAEPEEVSLGIRFIEAQTGQSGSLTPWEKYAQVLLMTNEFVFVD
jgi:hypothetical protein